MPGISDYFSETPRQQLLQEAMKITAEKREAGRFTFYTVRIASQEGREPFLEIKDCKLIEGRNGPFVGFPARKDDKNKWWPMVYASDAFQVEIIKAMHAAETDKRTHAERKRATQTAIDDDIPF